GAAARAALLACAGGGGGTADGRRRRRRRPARPGAGPAGHAADRRAGRAAPPGPVAPRGGRPHRDRGDDPVTAAAARDTLTRRGAPFTAAAARYSLRAEESALVTVRSQTIVVCDYFLPRVCLGRVELVTADLARAWARAGKKAADEGCRRSAPRTAGCWTSAL